MCNTNQRLKPLFRQIINNGTIPRILPGLWPHVFELVLSKPDYIYKLLQSKPDVCRKPPGKTRKRKCPDRLGFKV